MGREDWFYDDLGRCSKRITLPSFDCWSVTSDGSGLYVPERSQRLRSPAKSNCRAFSAGLRVWNYTSPGQRCVAQLCEPSDGSKKEARGAASSRRRAYSVSSTFVGHGYLQQRRCGWRVYHRLCYHTYFIPLSCNRRGAVQFGYRESLDIVKMLAEGSGKGERNSMEAERLEPTWTTVLSEKSQD